MLKQPPASPRPVFSFRLRLAAIAAMVAALALAAFLGAQEGARPGLLRKAFAQANEQAGQEMTVQPANGEDKSLPDIYRSIRPAGTGAEAPAIPPSETWPAQ